MDSNNNIFINSAYGDKEHEHIKIDGYTGKWSALEYTILDSGTYYIYENDIYGDMTCFLVIKYLDDEPIEVYETYDGLEQCLIDEDII